MDSHDLRNGGDLGGGEIEKEGKRVVHGGLWGTRGNKDRISQRHCGDTDSISEISFASTTIRG